MTGPVRSGKSTFAERLAHESGLPVVYVATAQPDPSDAEWTERIRHHRARRPAGWRLVETGSAGGIDLAGFVRSAPPGCCVLIDSLGTWLADEMQHETHALSERTERLRAALRESTVEIICVGEETGWGIVPAHPAGRAFRDELGRMQAQLAQEADRAYLIISGYALDLKTLGTRI